MKNLLLNSIFLLVVVCLSNPVFADDAPPCMDHGKTLGSMNAQALDWKKSKNDGFKARALVTGTVDEVFHDETGHRHFSLLIGSQQDDHVEVIYNKDFGTMPQVKVGDNATACGDFIVDSGHSGHGPSPDGAIVHWVHQSPNPEKHDDGYVLVNGKLFGFEENK